MMRSVKLANLGTLCALLVACGRSADVRDSDRTGSLSNPTQLVSLGGVVVGTPADTVLAIRGKAQSIRRRENDPDGLVVEWHYQDGTYIFARREVDGISVYRVVEIQGTASNVEAAARNAGKAAEPKSGASVISALYTSALATRYLLTPGEGWAVQNGEFNNTVSTAKFEETSIEISTRGSSVVGAGVVFIGKGTLAAEEENFVRDFLRWLDSNAAVGKAEMGKINRNLTASVQQIDLAPVLEIGRLRVRAAHVGPDAVISMRVK